MQPFHREFAGVWRSKVLIASYAFILTISFFLFTGLIPGLAKWYSSSMPYRQQTEAFLNGRIGLSNSPADVGFDMAWCRGQVQQVWGLGIPLWRIIFEAPTRALGGTAFPDRLCIAAAMWLWCYILLECSTSPDKSNPWLRKIGTDPSYFFTVSIVCCFPPIAALASGYFTVYEEPILYGYFYCTGLFYGLLSFLQRPSRNKLVLIAFMSGLAGFIRPTLESYALATIIILLIIEYGYHKSKLKILFGACLFFMGGALLLFTNWWRFGSPLEFGHRLNFSLPELTFASRFGAPFQSEPFAKSVKELVGALFFVHHPITCDPTATDIFRWQSSTIRWRYFNASGFDIFFLLLVSTSLIMCVACCFRCRKDKFTSRNEMETMLFCGWSFAALLPLLAFYLRFHAIASRYLLDFAPAVAVLCVSVFRDVTQRIVQARRYRLIPFPLASCAVWIAWELCHVEFVVPPGDQVVTKADLSAMKRLPNTLSSWVSFPKYGSGMNLPLLTGIPRNGWGWDLGTGHASPLVTFFADGIEAITLNIEPSEGVNISNAQWRFINVKVGLDDLRLRSSTKTRNGRILIFDPPEERAYNEGIHSVFITFVPPEDLRAVWSTFTLREISFHYE